METWQVLLILLVILFVYILIVYNKLVKGKLHVEQAKSSIDIYLKQRFDLIPNLVECVKTYCKYEKETLTEIARLREIYNNSKDLETGSILNNKFNTLIAVAENYPELKANEQFLMLEKNLAKIENQLQAARRLYNTEVTSFNTKINMFPSSIIANLGGFKPAKLFELENEQERKNINVEL